MKSKKMKIAIELVVCGIISALILWSGYMQEVTIAICGVLALVGLAGFALNALATDTATETNQDGCAKKDPIRYCYAYQGRYSTNRFRLKPGARVAQLGKASIFIALAVSLAFGLTVGAVSLVSLFALFILIDLVFGGDLNHAIRTRYATQIAKAKKAIRDPDFHALVTLPAVSLAGLITMIACAVSQ